MSAAVNPRSQDELVERITLSLTSAVRNHPKIRSLQKLKRLSAYVEGLIIDDLRRTGQMLEAQMPLVSANGVKLSPAGEPSTGEERV